MLDTSARLLRLLALLQNRCFWTGKALAERLEVTERTVRRDVDRLRALGYPVDSSAGVAGGYHLGASARLPPLLLEDEEALAMSMGLRASVASGVSGLEESALRAMLKLEQVMPERLRGQLEGLHASIEHAQFDGPGVSAPVLGALARAAWSHQQASFFYLDRPGRRTERSVEPHGLVHFYRRWYLCAFDLTREDWRTFRVDRIEGDVEAGAAFVPRPIPEGSPLAQVQRSIKRGARPDRAKVLLHAPYETVQPKLAKFGPELEPVGPDRCRIESGLNDYRYLALRVALLGIPFEVESPPELQAEVERLAVELSGAAERGRAGGLSPGGGAEVAEGPAGNARGAE